MIETSGLSKFFGATCAVSELTFQVKPGAVTGFLGPNGSGKSTTMRMILGLDRPTSGRVLVGGQAYREIREPLRTIGALLDARGMHDRRSARMHLAMLAVSNGIAARRVAEVLETVGLGSVAGARVGGFSLGMRQRLGIAAALLGDPAVLMLDEPMNGLDTEGIRWLRGLLRGMAEQGRTVLLSSHVMSEMELTADHLLIIGAGRLLADEPMAEFIARHSPNTIRVACSENAYLATALAKIGAQAQIDGDALLVSGCSSAEVGAIAAEIGVILSELRPERATLEDLYTAMVEPHGQYRHAEHAS